MNAPLSRDPLLQPYRLRHLTLKNRLMSTSHEPAYSEDGLPKERYRLYHAEKAKGGIALTMTAGSAIVSRDSPAAFGNLHAYRDEIVPWLRELADQCHEHDCKVMIQITHLGRRTGWNKADWLPVLAPSPVREPAHRAFPKTMEDWDIERIIADYASAAQRMQAAGLDGIEFESYGHLMDGFWSPLTNRRDDEFFTDRLAHRVDDPPSKAQAVVERAAIVIIAGIDGRRPEAVHQMAVGFELDAVEAGRLHALGRARIVGDDALDVPVFHRLGEGAVRRLAHRRGRENGQPVGLVPPGAAAQMGDLDHHLAVVFVALVGEFAKPRDDLVTIGVKVAEGGGTVPADDRRACRHRQRDAALRLLGMIEPVAFLRQAVLGVSRLVAGRHQPVLQGQVLQPVGLEKRVPGERCVHRLQFTVSGRTFSRCATKSRKASAIPSSSFGSS